MSFPIDFASDQEIASFVRRIPKTNDRGDDALSEAKEVKNSEVVFDLLATHFQIMAPALRRSWALVQRADELEKQEMY